MPQDLSPPQNSPVPDVAAPIDWVGLILQHRGSLIATGSSPKQVARHCNGFAYVAVAYDLEASIRKEWRIERSTRQSVLGARELAFLYEAGVSAICPTVQRAEILHAAATLSNRPKAFDAQFWAARSLPLLNAAAIVVVPDVQGWARCPMVWRDVNIALQHNVPIHLYAGGV